jgi:hypothetical protein
MRYFFSVSVMKGAFNKQQLFLIFVFVFVFSTKAE